MKLILGHAYYDENHKAKGGKAGDQLQTTVDDYKGEVRLQEFYVNKKGWVVLRLKKSDHAVKAASIMKGACNNPFLGYNQDDRYGVVREGTRSLKPVNCDCSTLVRTVFKEATGVDPGDFTTADEVKTLTRTGLVEEPIQYVEGKTTLYVGDILVTPIKGHTAVMVEAMPRVNPYPVPDCIVTSDRQAKHYKVKNYVSRGETVKWVQWMLCALGYQYRLDKVGGIDGVCGTVTVECILEFQLIAGIEVDGLCGTETRLALNKAVNGLEK